MNISLEGIDFNVREFENSEGDIKKLAETIDELLEILKVLLKNL